MSKTLFRDFFKFFRNVFHPAVQAIRLYGWPFLLMQCCAGAIVVAYYQSHTVQMLCAHIAEWKVQGGIIFSALTTAFAGGILPEIAKILTGKSRSSVNDILFNAVLFANVGVFVDLWYQLQGIMFGYDSSWKTVAIKVVIDQGVFGPLFMNSYIIFLCLLYQHRFRPIKTIRACNVSFFRDRLLQIAFPGWLYWIPMASFAYTMPATLQFPFFVCAQSAWSLVILFIIKADNKST